MWLAQSADNNVFFPLVTSSLPLLDVESAGDVDRSCGNKTDYNVSGLYANHEGDRSDEAGDEGRQDVPVFVDLIHYFSVHNTSHCRDRWVNRVFLRVFVFYHKEYRMSIIIVVVWDTLRLNFQIMLYLRVI